MFRLKITFGDGLSSKTIERQKIEVQISSKTLNKMTGLGMPETYIVKKAA
jgi:ethanolamine ammonia-lyase small subunit